MCYTVKHEVDRSSHVAVNSSKDIVEVMLQISDKKLKGKMQHAERLSSEAALTAAKTDDWLLPAEAGTLEAEGMERTWRFSQVCSQLLSSAARSSHAAHKAAAHYM